MLTPTTVAEVLERVRAAAEEGEPERAWEELRTLEPLLDSVHEVARTWIALIGFERPDDALEALARIANAWSHDHDMVYRAVDAMLAEADGRPADEEIDDDDPSFAAIAIADAAIARLSSAESRDPEIGGHLWNLLGNACRLAGPRFDDKARAAYRAALAIDNRAGWRFNLGLLHKNRGRFAEGVALYSELAREDPSEPTLWNLAICATGARDGATAVAAWRALEFDAELGDDGLPVVENLGNVKVRLTSGGFLNPYGDRDHEHVWVKPRSPCHGTIENPTMYDVGVDYSDVVLWDGQPIGYVMRGERRVPRFAVLAKLGPGSARTYTFRARLPSADAVETLDRALPAGVYAYPFEQNVVNLCKDCIRDPSGHTAEHEGSRGEQLVVRGKLVVETDDTARAVFSTLTQAIRAIPGLVVAIPDLLTQMGDAREAERHRALFANLEELQ